eukprot:1313631-Pyramimonas_sp.AAC.1
MCIRDRASYLPPSLPDRSLPPRSLPHSPPSLRLGGLMTPGASRPRPRAGPSRGGFEPRWTGGWRQEDHSKHEADKDEEEKEKSTEGETSKLEEAAGEERMRANEQNRARQ